MDGIENAFEQSVSACFKCKNVKILVALSGGADSTALLAALAAVRSTVGSHLYCVHIDHGIREPEETNGDAAAVRKLCGDLSIPLRIYRIPRGRIVEDSRKNGLGIEATARNYRQSILRRERRRVRAQWIALGHTRNDALEQVLMRVFRGSGPQGLAPMPVVRKPLIRPLLNFTRAEVEAYLACRGLGYRTDSTNRDVRYFRNLVRLCLVPYLDTLFPSWSKSIESFSETQGLVSAYISQSSERDIRWEHSSPGDERELSIGSHAFFACHSIVREEALYMALNSLASKTVDRESMNPDGQEARAGHIRRVNLRRFAQGAATSLDLGWARLDNRKDRISVRLSRNPSCLEGCSLVVEKEGQYRIGTDYLITAMEDDPGITEPHGFRAWSPTIFRSAYPEDRLYHRKKARTLSEVLHGVASSEYSDIIVAEDLKGIAAVMASAIDLKVILVTRDNCIVTDSEGGTPSLLFSVLSRR